VSEAKKVEFDRVAMVATPRFEQTGAMGAGDALSTLVDVDTKLELESSADDAQVAEVVRQAERMCFLMDAIRSPRTVNATVSLNGKTLAPAD